MTEETGIQSSLCEDDMKLYLQQVIEEVQESDRFTSLVESIQDLGLLQPVYVIETKDKTFEVVDGGRRLRAAKFLNIPTVPAMIFQGGENETEIRKCALVANIQRKDLTLEEKGEGLGTVLQERRS